MSNEVQNTNANLPANDGYSNPFIEYGDAVAMTRIVGKLLKFDKFGEWISGEDGEVLKAGTELIANIDELLVGWVKWQDNKPVEQVMMRIADGKKPQPRDAMGDLDKSTWEVDDEGHERDPWQLSNYLIMKARDSDELYTYATASRGGIQAIGKLAKEYGHAMRYRPTEHPVVAIDQSYYMHPKKEWGKIKIPVLDIVDWAPKEEMARALSSKHASQEELALDKPASKPAANPAPSAATRF
jgi:hypothetical protein